MYENENIPYARRSPAESLVDNVPNFRTLEVGQSFFVPDAEGENARNPALPVAAANAVLAPKQFKVRAEAHPVTGKPGRRVYRVEDADAGQEAAGDGTV